MLSLKGESEKSFQVEPLVPPPPPPPPIGHPGLFTFNFFLWKITLFTHSSLGVRLMPTQMFFVVGFFSLGRGEGTGETGIP